jgi:hypothetical protein
MPLSSGDSGASNGDSWTCPLMGMGRMTSVGGRTTSTPPMRCALPSGILLSTSGSFISLLRDSLKLNDSGARKAGMVIRMTS